MSCPRAALQRLVLFYKTHLALLNECSNTVIKRHRRLMNDLPLREKHLEVYYLQTLVLRSAHLASQDADVVENVFNTKCSL